MKSLLRLSLIPSAAVLVAASLPFPAQAQSSDSGYKVVQSAKVGGPGGWDYLSADADTRRLYIPRGNRVTVYDLDTLQPAGTIVNTNNVHGVAIDPTSHHAFCSSRPVVMWDTASLTALKTIPVKGSPDGILFEPFTERVYVLSHDAPNVTVINAKDGSIVGTIDLGGEPEQAASDGNGHVYIDVESNDNVAVVDARTLQVTGHYDVSAKAKGPGALALDAKNHVLFAFCHEPSMAVILDAGDGHIITSLPIGNGVDAAEFNPATGEAFSSQGDGTLTVIKETSPTEFAVEQTVATKSGARTSTLDSKTNRIFLIAADRMAAPAPAAPPAAPADGSAAPAPRRGRAQMVPGSFTILVVGK